MDKKTYNKNNDFWRDSKVITLKKLRNRKGDIIPKGSICTVTQKFSGFNISYDKSKRLIFMLGVSRKDLDLIKEEDGKNG